MSLSKNLIAGLVNSFWTALVGLAVVPFYLKHLGIEAYGLVGFFMTLQALFQLLDMGLAPTINREVARQSADGNIVNSGQLLHTLAVAYWYMAVFIVLLLLVLSPWIANNWLQSEQLSPSVIMHAIMLMGLVIACRWPISLYQSALIGAQRIDITSSINIIMVTLGNLGAVAVLAFVSPTLEAFFIWQAGVNLFYAFTIRRAAWQVIGRTKKLKFDLGHLKTVWRFSVGMSGIAILGLLLNQLDKVILSKILSLDAFAHYMLATVIVNGLFVLVSPTFNVIYPRFTELIIAGDNDRLIKLYHMGTRALASIVFPVAMFLAVFAEDLVYIWTGNIYVAVQVSPIISILVMGTAIQGIMYFPYALQLANGMTRLPLLICSIMVMVMVPQVILFAKLYQARGGAMAWVSVNVIYLFLGTWLTHQHLLKGIGGKWLTQDVGIPLLLSVLAGFFGYWYIQTTTFSVYLKVLFGIGLMFTTASVSALLSSKIRTWFVNSNSWKMVKF